MCESMKRCCKRRMGLWNHMMVATSLQRRANKSIRLQSDKSHTQEHAVQQGFGFKAFKLQSYSVAHSSLT